MKRVIFIEDGKFLKIEILMRDSLYWILPVLLVVFPGFFCGSALIFVSLAALIKNIDIPIIPTVLGVFLFVTCGYGMVCWMFNCFGKEVLSFDDTKGCFSYKKALFKIGTTKKFYYRDMSAFIASDSLLPYLLRKKTDIWAKCEFVHKGKKFRIGNFRMLKDAEKVTDIVNKHIKAGEAKVKVICPTLS